MGLDMYLYKKTDVKNWDFTPSEDRYEIIIKKGGVINKNIQIERVTEVVETVVQWRKANAIHKWFVENVQDGVDDCKEYYVELTQLKQVRDLCEKVIKNPEKAQELLPTQDGFFFGDNLYDEHYFSQLEKTLRALQEITKEEESIYANYYYGSSW